MSDDYKGMTHDQLEAIAEAFAVAMDIEFLEECAMRYLEEAEAGTLVIEADNAEAEPRSALAARYDDEEIPW